MSLTSIIVNDRIKKVTKYIQIVTTPLEEGNGIHVAFKDMDEKFEFEQGADQCTDKRTEQEYHTELRAMAAEKEQLITSHSTDPEWNPEGYVKNLDNGSM